MIHMKDTIDWAAGILEGEGCFSLKPRYNRQGVVIRQYPTVTLVMTDEDIVRRVSKVFNDVGRVALRDTPTIKANPHWKSSWCWEVQAQHDAIVIMKQVQPYMGVRRKEAIQKAIDCYNKRPTLHRPNDNAPAGHKWCPSCKAHIHQNLFSPNKKRSDGLASHCRSCRRAAYKARKK